MAGTVGKVEGSQVALEGPQPTTINISLHQESGLAYLCRGVVALARPKAAPKDAKDAKDAGEAPRAPRPAGGEQKVLGGAQILLGAVCIGLGVVLSVVLPNGELSNYFKRSIYNGVPFWMGGLFILSGTFSVVGARRSGYWVHLATFLNLGSVVAGSVAFTLGLTDFAPLFYEPYFLDKLCKHRAEHQGYRSWEATTRPPYDDKRDQERAKQCQETLMGLVRMWSSTQILLLIVHVAALATALFCFRYGLRRLCCSCWGGWRDYVALEDPDVSSVPDDLGKEQSPA
ncbi:transmembrane protein 176A-like [Protobothrops mucrosquamatus]|uniref:transmembrane protein 176A-like n=1 Tax=Protobothrops mucrosquamatus TaxID=103944 RepID=UPI0007758B61|nr:transmembrane protein 176A-like [Protobothrops mucrosquamatus]